MRMNGLSLLAFDPCLNAFSMNAMYSSGATFRSLLLLLLLLLLQQRHDVLMREQHYLPDSHERPVHEEVIDYPFYYSSIYNSGFGKPLNSDAVTVV